MSVCPSASHSLISSISAGTSRSMFSKTVWMVAGNPRLAATDWLNSVRIFSAEPETSFDPASSAEVKPGRLIEISMAWFVPGTW